MATPKLPQALLALLVIFALAIGASACGEAEESGARADNQAGFVEGEPVAAGPLSITVLSSRKLDRGDKADAAYLVGQPPAGGGLFWVGVFVEIENKGKRAEQAPWMTLSDATGRSYSAFPSNIDSVLKFGATVEPGGQLPAPGEGAQPPDEGTVVLFRLGQNAVKDQPLTLHIEGFEQEDAEVKLDL